jgi:hypothetical protein
MMTPSLRLSRKYVRLPYKEKSKKLGNVCREQNFWWFFLFISLGFTVMNRPYLIAKAEAKRLLGKFRRK